MNEDEQRVRSILSFTFKKMAEEFARPGPEESSQPKEFRLKYDGKEQPVVNSVRRGVECS
jgi:hypothetical protein